MRERFGPKQLGRLFAGADLRNQGERQVWSRKLYAAPAKTRARMNVVNGLLRYEDLLVSHKKAFREERPLVVAYS